MLFELIVDVADYAEQRIEIGMAKLRPTEQEKNPNTRFIRNRVVEQLRTSDSLTIAAKGLKWGENKQLVKELYKQLIDSAHYKAYMAAPGDSFEADKKLVINFYKTQIEDNELLELQLEDLSIFWNDDTNFALGHVISTLASLREGEDLEIMPMYKNEEDEEYADELYRRALVNAKEYFGYIEKFANNWDFERIALMDKVIIESAIAELITFPSIPVKVTLDEFIEISKYYSTPNSSTFINGIIDRAITELTAEGKIAKSGRGLIE
ncbi:Transcription termination protein NusB [Mucinivorans hirudinis]|uniref:Transcription termination protein NusB n=1 Tax=Mucinivorans hirudinis TaxID=1433126 RepID=A0A060RCX8_9BACT|nr:Transcription termination protein NusB [Mucinivorans hirudinis]